MTAKAEMSFWDHLEALRWMLMRVFIVLAVLIVAGFVFIPDIFDSVILAPCNNDFFPSFLRKWPICALSYRARSINPYMSR